MPSRGHVIGAIYAAWRLALLDPGGMRHFDLSIEGFWRSFFAAVVVAPFYVVLVLLHFEQATGAGADLGVFVLVNLLTYAISWSAFVVAMIFLGRLLSLDPFYVPFIVAYNWSQVIQIGVFLPASALHESAVLPEGLSAALVMMATLAILFYQWFVTRTALQATALTAAGLVAFDVLLGVLVDVAGTRMLLPTVP